VYSLVYAWWYNHWDLDPGALTPMDNPLDFGAWLRRIRLTRDLTQEALAEAVGCATQTIRSFELGRRRPSREMASRIADVLGLPPAERDQMLARARAPLVAPQLAPASQAPVELGTAPLRPLPRPSSLIGRQSELAWLRQALLADERRLVTLLGPGGIGKTCLALQIAAELAPQLADGAAFVALAPVGDADGLTIAIAQAVGCPLAGVRAPAAALVEFLRDHEALLVLDNFEQLLGPGRQSLALLSDLLGAAPGLRLLVTSRERLHLRDERVIPVDGLPLPDERPGAMVERAPAALLFLERAQQADPNFALTLQNRESVARICRLLGGVPLAIELAAAWTRVLAPAEIAEQVARDAAALSATSYDLPERHRSLGAVLDHSWQLLAPAERRLLAHLSVFHGGCRREAIGAVLGEYAGGDLAILQHLAALVDRSLVRRLDEDGATRYDLHEFVRQYAAARLAEDQGSAVAAEARHEAHYAAWLAAQEPALKSARQRVTGEAIALEFVNIRAAWRRACARQDAATLRLMLPSLDWFYELRGWYDEAAAAFAMATQALQPAAEAADAPELTLTCYWLAYGRVGFHTLRRDPAFGVRRLAESVAELRRVSRSGEQIHCLKGLAYINMFAGSYKAAEGLLEEARAIAVARGDQWNLAMTLVIRGVMEALRSEAPRARAALAEALAVARAVGDPRPISMALVYLGLAALALGEAGEAGRAAREAYLLAAEHEDRFLMSLALQTLGRVATLTGERAEAGWLLDESLAIARAMGDRWLEAQALGCLADLAAARGDLAAARSGRRAALAVAAAAPQAIALDALIALAALELAERAEGALVALAYVRRHPLTRPAARAGAEAHWEAAAQAFTPEELAAAEAAAAALPGERPAGLLDLFGA
jgi:predicted ATPase/DNA-binding XRE family transcriptional regulator